MTGLKRHSIYARLSKGAATSVVLASALALPAWAQQQASARGGLEDIVVTATRVSTNVQDVPLAISAVGGSALRDQGITDPRSLSGVAPGLFVDQGAGNGQIHVSIRGLASTDLGFGAQSPSAVYIDDVFQPFQFGIATQVFDLNRIEVLRGPQGTLFGKNTTGGALLYYSQAPTDKNEGYILADIGGGYYSHQSAEGAINMANGDGTFRSRLSFRFDRRDDYVKNLYNGTEFGKNNNYNLRYQLAWVPSDQTSVNLIVYGMLNRGDPNQYILRYDGDVCGAGLGTGYYFLCNPVAPGGVPTPAPSDPRHTYSEVNDIFENYHTVGSTLKVEHEMGGYKLTAITNVQSGKYSQHGNDDGAAADYFTSYNYTRTWQASQEVRVATPQDKPLKAVVGAIASYDHIRQNSSGASGLTFADPSVAYLFLNKGVQGTKTGALFSSVTLDVTPRFSLIGGARYSLEHKKITDSFYSPIGFGVLPLVPDDAKDLETTFAKYGYDPLRGDVYSVDRDRHTWRKLTWDATANFRPTDDVLLYGKVARGFRSGGWPIGTTGAGTFRRLSPEVITSYEIGWKTEFLDKHVRFNGDVFLMDYSNMQVQTFVPGPNGFPVLVRENAGKSRIKGIEAELQVVPVSGLNISLSGAYTDAKYRDYNSGIGVNFKGNRLPYSPKFNGRASASYEIPFGDNRSLTLGGDLTYRSRVYFGPENYSLVGDPGRTIGNLSVSYGATDKGFRVYGYVNNVGDVLSRAGGYGVNPDGPIIADINVWNPGRLWGLKLQYKY